MAINHVFVNKD